MKETEKRIKNGVAAGLPLIDIYHSMAGALGKAAFFRVVLALVQEKEIPNLLVCHCGHDCSRCLTFRATLADDDGMRRQVVDFYKTEFGQRISLESVHCLSGRSDEMMAGCRACPYLRCSTGKGLRECAACPQYACPQLAWYMEKYVNKVNQI